VNIKLYLIFLISISLTTNINAQEIPVFIVNQYEINEHKAVGLISLSDIYPYSEHPDSLAIPNTEAFESDSLSYIHLDSMYRERFLLRTNISESDSVFIYDYASNASASFSVKDLNLAACLNVYASEDDRPFTQFSYMIGFVIDTAILQGYSLYNIHTLVGIGNENPFIKGQMKPVKWKQIRANEFPELPSAIKENIGFYRLTRGNSYKAETAEFQYFITDLLIDSMLNSRHLWVIDNHSYIVVCEKFYSDREGTSLAPLNYNNAGNENEIYQWTGSLFKNKPPVIFGFLFQSFGCPGISFLNTSVADIYIQCDNRH
jgi:hypothetical protein